MSGPPLTGLAIAARTELESGASIQDLPSAGLDAQFTTVAACRYASGSVGQIAGRRGVARPQLPRAVTRQPWLRGHPRVDLPRERQLERDWELRAVSSSESTARSRSCARCRVLTRRPPPGGRCLVSRHNGRSRSNWSKHGPTPSGTWSPKAAPSLPNISLRCKFRC
jgi:hypothetical protein